MSLRPKRRRPRTAVALVSALASALAPFTANGAAPPEAAAAAVDGADPAATDEDKQTAKQLAEDGRALYWKGEYRAAINAFEQAHRLVPDPNLLFNISTAYEKLGEPAAALEYLDRYAQQAPEAEQPAIAAKRAELSALADASAEVDDAAEDGGEQDGDEGPGGASDEGPERGPADPTVPAPAGVTPGPLDGADERPVMGALGWSLAGASVVALGVGVGLGVSAGQLSSNGEAACQDVGGALRCPGAAENDLVRAQRRALGADIAFGVAALTGVATLAVLGVRLARRKKAEQREQRVRVSATPGGAALSF